MNGRSLPKIVVVGGGFAGLESAFYLRWRLREHAEITLVSATDRFLFKPNTIYVPFGLDPETLMIPLEKPTRRKSISFVNDRVREIDPIRNAVSTESQTLRYDYLILATGAGMRPEEIPGLAEFAETIWTPEAMLQLRAAYDRMLFDVHAGKRRKVLFLVPPNNKCAGPLYEMVFMLDSWLRQKGAREGVDITWSTYEKTFIQAFGPRLHEVVTSEFARRRIAGHGEYVVDRVEPNEVIYQNGETLPYDLLVSFPPYVASTPFLPGLPADDRGFVQTHCATRQVIDHPHIYAAGDAGDFPVKQAFLAFLQADAAAEHLASDILGTQARIQFEPSSMCVMEQFDKATFAQVPLHLTGIPDRPIEVDPAADGAYRVGSSVLWRPGKKLLGIYLPWRFNAGEPFHAGLPWKGMEMGLNVMSHLLAS